MTGLTKAEYLSQVIEAGAESAEVDAVFVGLVYNVADTTSPALAAESLAELRALVDVYKAYRDERFAEAEAWFTKIREEAETDGKDENTDY